MAGIDVKQLHAPGSTLRRPPLPRALKAAAEAFAAKHKDAVNDPDDPALLVSWLERGSVDSVLSHVAGLKDAGQALPVASNAGLYLLQVNARFPDRREGWILDPPGDGKLRLQVVMAPSWSSQVWSTPDPPDDAPEAAWEAHERAWQAFERSCATAARKFALENTYEVSVTRADGSVVEHRFGVNGKDPEWSSASPEIAIDLGYKGDIIVRGHARGFAAADAWPSARVTVLHNS